VNSCLWVQGLGKGWLPAFPRLRPFSGFRAGRLLESPLAKRVEPGSTKSVGSEDACSSLRPADDKRPQLRAWCHRQAFWEPRGNCGGQSHVFHVTNRPEGKGQGGGPINRLGLIPRRGSRCTSPPNAPLAWPAAWSAERRGCPPASRPKHIPCPPQPGVANESNLRVYRLRPKPRGASPNEDRQEPVVMRSGHIQFQRTA
jgi:hypothetical protein